MSNSWVQKVQYQRDFAKSRYHPVNDKHNEPICASAHGKACTVPNDPWWVNMAIVFGMISGFCKRSLLTTYSTV